MVGLSFVPTRHNFFSGRPPIKSFRFFPERLFENNQIQVTYVRFRQTAFLVFGKFSDFPYSHIMGFHFLVVADRVTTLGTSVNK